MRSVTACLGQFWKAEAGHFSRAPKTGFGVFNFIGPFTGGVVAAGAGALKSSIGIGGSLEIAGVLLAISAVVLARVSPR